MRAFMHRALARDAILVVGALTLLTPTLASAAPAKSSTAPTVVELERVRPRRENHPTLRFLKENRDFIRARFDLMREKLVAGHGSAEAIDPRYLAYSKMLGEIQADGDSVAIAARSRAGLDLLTSITQLGQLGWFHTW